jgi:peptidoglycan/LPS O-acetylase OafA/YrhL
VKNIARLCAIASIALFFAFDLLIPSKFIYNKYHPIISLPPILGFVILRNWNETTRRYNSRLWIWIGKMSLETFLLQVSF